MKTINKTYNRLLAIEKQEEYCSRMHFPDFTPLFGFCDFCGQDIFGLSEYSVEEAGSEHITGCPHCRYSFCE